MAKLRIIFVHGISPTVIQRDYAADFRTLIVEKLQDTQILPSEASPQQVAQVITFESINYSAIGQAEEDRVLNAYREERQSLYNPLDKIIEKLGFDAIRRELITSIGDVLVYQSDFWRDHIRNLLKNRIDPYIQSGDAVSLIGHSLGSVVAFDVAYYNSRHDAAWLQAGFKPTNLFMLGSPLALFSLEMDENDGIQKPRYIPESIITSDRDPASTNPDIQPVHANGVWYNFLDAQDVIAYPVKLLFKDKFKVEDILVQTGTEPISTHSGYWQNEEVATKIAKRLELDYERVRDL